jgi:hypothetical protein
MQTKSIGSSMGLWQVATPVGSRRSSVGRQEQAGSDKNSVLKDHYRAESMTYKEVIRRDPTDIRQ